MVTRRLLNSCLQLSIQSSRRPRISQNSLWIAVFAALSLGVCIPQSSYCESAEDLPVISRSEVQAHRSLTEGDGRVWVTHEEHVYDITKFINNHPGGRDKILLAAGQDLAPFWNLYRQHFSSQLAMEQLQKMRIGRLPASELQQGEAQQDPDDPFSRDPSLSPLMRVLVKQPINAEPPAELLTHSWITPRELWFVRNHHPVVHLSAADSSLSVTLAAAPGELVRFSLQQLHERLRKVSVVSTVQCGGNRRGEMSGLRVTNGSGWDVSAISTAKWTGFLLRDVLRLVGVTESAVFEPQENQAQHLSALRHVVFVSHDGVEVSVPVRKALSLHGDVLLAVEMNDEPLDALHGGPLRVIVPGYVGVRNLKWLKEIRLSGEEAQGPWQRGMAYKGFGPSVRSVDEVPDVAALLSVQEQPVQSAITSPPPSAVLAAGDVVTVKGYAYSGGGRGIARVDVSVDGGQSWRTAALTDGSQQPVDRAWAWTFWELDVEVPEDAQELQLVCKATDAAYNVQPESVRGIWNLRGLNNNAWHRVALPIRPPQVEDDE